LEKRRKTSVKLRIIWSYNTIATISGVARYSQWEGGLGTELPAARGYWGYGDEAPSAGRFLQFFNKNNAFFCIFRV